MQALVYRVMWHTILNTYSPRCSILSLECHEIYTWHKESWINHIAFVTRESWSAVALTRWRTRSINWASQVAVASCTTRILRSQTIVPILRKQLAIIVIQMIILCNENCGWCSGEMVNMLHSGSSSLGCSANQASVLHSWARRFTPTVPLHPGVLNGYWQIVCTTWQNSWA